MNSRTTPAPPPLIRAARRSDCAGLLELVHALAEFEREPAAVKATTADLERALFGQPLAAGALVAEQAGELVGMALYYRTFSTWTGRQGIHLEDLFVTPAARAQGIGKALLVALADQCQREGLPRLEWSVLTWNAPAIGFYRCLGAVPLEEWRTWRLDGEALGALALSAPAIPDDPPAVPSR